VASLFRQSNVPPLCSIAALVLAVVVPLPYGFYTLLRLVVCGSAAYMAVRTAQRRSAWMWVMVGVALLFNPLVPVLLAREVWRVLDLLAAAIFGGLLFAERKDDA
jgi:hypothetical protein